MPRKSKSLSQRLTKTIQRTQKRQTKSREAFERARRAAQKKRNPRRSPGYVILIGSKGEAVTIYSIPEAQRLARQRPELYKSFSQTWGTLIAARRAAARMNRAAGSAAKRNPRRVMIYPELVEIVARKGPGHRCDAECRAANHTYIHKFKRGSAVYGEPDGSITIE